MTSLDPLPPLVVPGIELVGGSTSRATRLCRCGRGGRSCRSGIRRCDGLLRERDDRVEFEPVVRVCRGGFGGWRRRRGRSRTSKNRRGSRSDGGNLKLDRRCVLPRFGTTVFPNGGVRIGLGDSSRSSFIFRIKLNVSADNQPAYSQIRFSKLEGYGMTARASTSIPAAA